MSYINRKTRAFRDAGDIEVVKKRSDGRMKNYLSATDARAWCDFTEDRRQYILELVKQRDAKGLSIGKYIPLEAIIDILLANKNADIKRLQQENDELRKFIKDHGLKYQDKELEREIAVKNLEEPGPSPKPAKSVEKPIVETKKSTETAKKTKSIEETKQQQIIDKKSSLGVDAKTKQAEEDAKAFEDAKKAADDAKAKKEAEEAKAAADLKKAADDAKAAEDARRKAQEEEEARRAAEEAQRLAEEQATPIETKKSEEKPVVEEAPVAVEPATDSGISTAPDESDMEAEKVVVAEPEPEETVEVPSQVVAVAEELEDLAGDAEAARRAAEEAAAAKEQEEKAKKLAEDEAKKRAEAEKKDRDRKAAEEFLAGKSPDDQLLALKDALADYDEESANYYKLALAAIEQLEEIQDIVDEKGRASAAKKQMDAKMKELDQIKNERDKLKARVKQLEDELKKMKNLPNDIENLKQKSFEIINPEKVEESGAGTSKPTKSTGRKDSSIGESVETLGKRYEDVKDLPEKIRKLKGTGGGDCQQEINKLLAKIKDLEDELKKSNSCCKDMEILKVENNCLRMRLDDLQQIRRDYDELLVKTKDYDAIKAELEALKKKYEKLKELECECEKLQNQVSRTAQLEKERELLLKEIENCECCMNIKDDEIKRLNCHIECLNNDLDKRQDQMKTKVVTMRACLEKKDSIISQSEQQLANVQDELRNSIEHLSCETGMLRTRIEELETLINQYQCTLCGKKRELAEALEEIKLLKDEKRKLEELLKKAMEGDEHFKQMLKHTKCAVKCISKKLEKHEISGSRAESERENLLTKIAQLEKELESANGRIKVLEERLADKQQVAAENESLRRLSGQIQCSAKEMNAKLEAEKANLLEKLRLAEERLKMSGDQGGNEELIEKIKKLENEIEALRAENEKLKEQVLSSKGAEKIEELAQGGQNMKEQLENLQKELVNKASIEKENKDLKDELDRLKNELMNKPASGGDDNLEKELKKEKGEKDELLKENENLKNEIKNLKDEINRLIQEKRPAVEDTKKDTSAEDALRNELDKMKEKIAAMTQEKMQQAEKSSDVTKERDELLKQIEAQKAEIKDLLNKIKQASADDDSTFKELEKKNKENDNLKLVIKDLEKQLEDLRKSTTKSVPEPSPEIDKTVKDLTGRLEQEEKKCKDLEDELKKCKENQKRMKEMEDELNKLREGEKRTKELEDELKKLKEGGNKNEDELNKLKDMEKRNKELEDELKKCKENEKQQAAALAAQPKRVSISKEPTRRKSSVSKPEESIKSEDSKQKPAAKPTPEETRSKSPTPKPKPSEETPKKTKPPPATNGKLPSIKEEECEKKLQELQETLARQKKDCSEMIASLKEQYERDIKAIRDQNEESINKLQKSQQEIVENLSKQHEDELENFKEELRKSQLSMHQLSVENQELKKQTGSKTEIKDDSTLEPSEISGGGNIVASTPKKDEEDNETKPSIAETLQSSVKETAESLAPTTTTTTGGGTSLPSEQKSEKESQSKIQTIGMVSAEVTISGQGRDLQKPSNIGRPKKCTCQDVVQQQPQRQPSHPQICQCDNKPIIIRQPIMICRQMPLPEPIPTPPPQPPLSPQKSQVAVCTQTLIDCRQSGTANKQHKPNCVKHMAELENMLLLRQYETREKLELLQNMVNTFKNELEREKQKNNELICRYTNQSNTVANMRQEINRVKQENSEDKQKLNMLNAQLRQMLECQCTTKSNCFCSKPQQPQFRTEVSIERPKCMEKVKFCSRTCRNSDSFSIDE